MFNPLNGDLRSRVLIYDSIHSSMQRGVHVERQIDCWSDQAGGVLALRASSTSANLTKSAAAVATFPGVVQLQFGNTAVCTAMLRTSLLKGECYECLVCALFGIRVT